MFWNCVRGANCVALVGLLLSTGSIGLAQQPPKETIVLNKDANISAGDPILTGNRHFYMFPAIEVQPLALYTIKVSSQKGRGNPTWDPVVYLISDKTATKDNAEIFWKQVGSGTKPDWIPLTILEKRTSAKGSGGLTFQYLPNTPGKLFLFVANPNTGYIPVNLPFNVTITKTLTS